MARAGRLRLWLAAVAVWLLAGGVAAAGSEWATLLEMQSVDYQVDRSRVQFSAAAEDVVLDMWLKAVHKDRNGMSIVSHYIIRESDLSFILKERAIYAPNGESMGPTDSTAKGWTANAADSPVGVVAKRLFVEYREAR